MTNITLTKYFVIALHVGCSTAILMHNGGYDCNFIGIKYLYQLNNIGLGEKLVKAQFVKSISSTSKSRLIIKTYSI